MRLSVWSGAESAFVNDEWDHSLHTLPVVELNCRIELYEALDTEENGDARARSDGHIDHLALKTSDLDALYEACQQLTIPIVSHGIESTDL